MADDDPRINSRPFDIDKQAIDDLYEEAGHWLDGSEVATDAEAEAIEKLLDMARKARDEADEHRKIENKPFDDGKKEVQKRFTPILDRADHIVTACRKALTPWREKVAAQKRKEAEEIARAAEEAARKAEEATKAAGTHLGAQQLAKGAEEEAERLQKSAQRASRNATKGIGMRTEKDVTVIDLKVTIAHYYRADRDWIAGIIQERAAADARKGAQDIPGVTIEDRKVAI